MIYILTVYDSLNYGSYLQAVSLLHELECYGQTCFLDIDHQSTFLQCLKKIAGHIAKRRFGGIFFEYKKWDIFRKSAQGLPIVHLKKLREAEDDIYVFGSDEIWNVDRRKFLKSPEFWGIGLKNGRRISYAPSLNTATKEQYMQHPELTEALNRFDYLSVRDERSKDVLCQLMDRPIEVVADPTFLFGIENFRRIEKKAEEKEPYMLVYTYGKMCRTPEQVAYIREAARREGLKIISVGKYLKWADKSVNTTPEGFLGYVDGAQSVLTDTFHGTVFSILYRKDFVEVHPSQKIQDLLHMFQLDSRVIPDVSQIEGVMRQKTDYSHADSIQNRYEASSRAYLNGAMAQAGRNTGI